MKLLGLKNTKLNRRKSLSDRLNNRMDRRKKISELDNETIKIAQSK